MDQTDESCRRDTGCRSTITSKPQEIGSRAKVSQARMTNNDNIKRRHESIVRFQGPPIYCPESDPNEAETKQIEPLVRNGWSFNFEKNCLFCGETASDEFLRAQKKKSPQLRTSVRKITDKSTRRSLIHGFESALDHNSLQILCRLLSVKDLAAVRARYHDSCHGKYRSQARNSEPRSLDRQITRSISWLCSHMLANANEGQFSVWEILESAKLGDHWPSTRLLREKLRDVFGDQVSVRLTEDGPIVCFRDPKVSALLTERWYRDRLDDEAAERRRIVELAARIVLEDVRTEEGQLPETLRTFLGGVVSSSRTEAIARSVVAAVRPRYFEESLSEGRDRKIKSESSAGEEAGHDESKDAKKNGSAKLCQSD